MSVIERARQALADAEDAEENRQIAEQARIRHNHEGAIAAWMIEMFGDDRDEYVQVRFTSPTGAWITVDDEVRLWSCWFDHERRHKVQLARFVDNRLVGGEPVTSLAVLGRLLARHTGWEKPEARVGEAS